MIFVTLRLLDNHLIINMKSSAFCVFSVTPMELCIVAGWPFENAVIQGNNSCLKNKKAGSVECRNRITRDHITVMESIPLERSNMPISTDSRLTTVHFATKVTMALKN